MEPEVYSLIRDAVSDGIRPSWLFTMFGMLGVGLISGYLAGYLKEKGKHLAKKRILGKSSISFKRRPQ